MTASATAFLEHLIDYAGMFPPASLDLETALHNYLAYQRQPTAWMLGRFICPAARIAELQQELAEFAGEPIPVSMLAPVHNDPTETLEILNRELRSVRRELSASARVRPEILEARIPAPLADPGAGPRLDDFLSQFRQTTAASELELSEIFFEAPGEHDRAPVWEFTLRAITRLNSTATDALPVAGFKIRCGGASRSAFPTPEEVALALDWTRREGIRLKATAGLHHPVRHQDPATGAAMHGFFNLFGAGILSHARPLGLKVLVEILKDEDPDNFQFTEQGLQWRELLCPPSRVREVRRTHLTSLGSCSFDEPRQDLAELGLLPGFQVSGANQ